MKRVLRARFLWSFIAGAMILAVFVRLGLALDADNEAVMELVQRQSHDASSPTVVEQASSREEPTTVESLVCFDCHNIERYRTGESFPHIDPEDHISHCHKCHAFSGHLGVSIRWEMCDECH